MTGDNASPVTGFEVATDDEGYERAAIAFEEIFAAFRKLVCPGLPL